ncbi:hypothetical protein [Streptomyces radicis]|uniref:hypothetical protein n=1 Tax=Streptomyces radicis TaxID=1750517 RepID=UPI0015FFEE60|nr:hypothetical protein [Streptomyces radicis]
MPDEDVRCAVVPEARFLATGHHEGGGRSTLFVNGGLPFDLADPLSVVAHEGHPGHIAESLLKEHHPDCGRRFPLSPPFVLSAGMGPRAREVVLPGDEAREWLERHVLGPFGIAPDGADLPAIHGARNALPGAWLDAGAPEERNARVRRLLIEPPLPADLAVDGFGGSGGRVGCGIGRGRGAAPGRGSARVAQHPVGLGVPAERRVGGRAHRALLDQVAGVDAGRQLPEPGHPRGGRLVGGVRRVGGTRRVHGVTCRS